MLMIQAIASCTATRENHITFTAGQHFYVLSATEDKSLYFVSTSARVPFSRSATSGYVQSSLFVIVGDTVAPPKGGQHSKNAGPQHRTDAILQESQSQPQRPSSASTVKISRPGSLASNKPTGIVSFRQSRNTTEERKGPPKQKLPAIPPEWEESYAEFENATSMAESGKSKSSLLSFSGLTAAARAFLGLAGGNSQSDAEVRPSKMAKGTTETAESVPGMTLTGARIVTYRRRKHRLGDGRRGPVEYKIVCTMPDAEDYIVTRSYTDFFTMHVAVCAADSLGFSNPLLLPEPLSAREEQTNAKQRGHALNVYLEELINLNSFLLSKGKSLPLLPFFTQDSKPSSTMLPESTATSTTTLAAPASHDEKQSVTRRPSSDSGFASRSSSRKSSLASELHGVRLPTVIQEGEPQDNDNLVIAANSSLTADQFGITERFLRKLDRFTNRPLHHPSDPHNSDSNVMPVQIKNVPSLPHVQQGIRDPVFRRAADVRSQKVDF